jgi:hypothetical protein
MAAVYRADLTGLFELRHAALRVEQHGELQFRIANFSLVRHHDLT